MNDNRPIKSVSLSQRAKLFDWCKAHSEDKRTYKDLCKEATAELGFTVSIGCMQNHWVAVNGKRSIDAKKSDVIKRIDSLEERMKACEERLNAQALKPYQRPFENNHPITYGNKPERIS